MKPALAGACLCALLSAPAYTQQPPPRPLVGGHGNNIEAFVAQHDGNADDRLTWEEFDAFRRTRFDATDANGDGTIDVEEYVQEFQDRMREQMEQDRGEQLDRHVATRIGDSDKQTRVRFGALDTDKDGKMSFAEYQVSGRRTFDAADRNHDGVVNVADTKLPPPSRAGRSASAQPAAD